MHKSLLIKTIAIICLVVVIVNPLLFSFQVYTAIVFWVIIIIIALIAFPGLKWLRKK